MAVDMNSVKPWPYGGWGPNCYHVKSLDDLHEIKRWLFLNKVRHLLVSTSPMGHVFKLQDNFELFRLTWL